MVQSFLAVQRGFDHHKSLVIICNVPDTGSTITKYGMKTQLIHTLNFVEVTFFLLGQQMRVSVFSGIHFSDKQRLEPVVSTRSVVGGRKAPI